MGRARALPAGSAHAMTRAVHTLAADVVGADQADKLLICGVLGQGGGGKVFYGKWRGLDVAIKVCGWLGVVGCGGGGGRREAVYQRWCWKGHSLRRRSGW